MDCIQASAFIENGKYTIINTFSEGIYFSWWYLFLITFSFVSFSVQWYFKQTLNIFYQISSAQSWIQVPWTRPRWSRCSPRSPRSPVTATANQSSQKRADSKRIAFDRFYWPDIGTKAGLILAGCAPDLACWADERWQMMRVAPGGLRTRQSMIC